MTKPELISFLQTWPKFHQTLDFIAAQIKEGVEKDPKCDFEMDELTIKTDFGILGEYITEENFSEKRITLSDDCVEVQIGLDILVGCENREKLCKEAAARLLAEILNFTKKARERREKEEREQLAALKKKYETPTPDGTWYIDFKDDKFILWAYVLEEKQILMSDNNIVKIVYRILDVVGNNCLSDSRLRRVILSDKAAEVVVTSTGEYPGSYDKALTQVMIRLETTKTSVSTGAVARL